MADMSHFLKKYPERDRHIWFLSGPYRRGVELVVDMITDMVSPLPTEVGMFHVGQDTLGDILDALRLASSFPRLVVVREAERITRWDAILNWARVPHTTYLILVSGEEDPRKGKQPEIFRWIATNGRFIEVKQFTRERAELVTSLMLAVSDEQAYRLVNKIGTSADVLLAELWKFRLAGLNLEEIMVTTATNPISDPIKDLFERPITMPSIGLGQLLGLLELELTRQAAVIGFLRLNLQSYEMCSRANIPAFIIRDLIDRTKRTHPIQLAGRLALVLRTQDLYYSGVHFGLETWFFAQWKAI